MQIFHLPAVMNFIGIWRPASRFDNLIYRAGCQLSVTSPLFCYFFSCLFVSVVLCDIFYIYITLNILIDPSYNTELVLQQD